LAQLKLADQKQALRKQIAALPPGLSMYNRDRVQLEGKLKGLDVLSGGSLTFDNPNGEAVLFDFYGNPIPTKDGKIVVPLDSHGFFLRGNGNPGAFDWLCKAVAGARIEGYEPLNVVAHDFTTPIEQKPSLRMTLTNILNRPITGSLDISLGDLKLNVPAKVEIQPNETKDVLIPIVDGTARPDNSYPLSFKFDAGTDGFAVLEEKLHVNVIAKRTITVDGNLDDWKGVLPYPVQASHWPRGSRWQNSIPRKNQASPPHTWPMTRRIFTSPPRSPTLRRRPGLCGLPIATMTTSSIQTQLMTMT
jgi:hypothetical protein